MMYGFQQIVTQAERRYNFVVHGLSPLGDEMAVSPPIWRKRLMDSISSNLDYSMKTIIQLSEAEEAKALPILLRHSSGTILPNRIYVVGEEAAKKLREAGVQFTELSRESNDSPLKGVSSGERI